MEVMKSKLSAQWWWFDSQTNSIPKKSPWLHSTLAGFVDNRYVIFGYIRIHSW
ncbi:hypothetical protein Hanom_Chr01g00003691 [Helianthus anomalus]